MGPISNRSAQIHFIFLFHSRSLISPYWIGLISSLLTCWWVKFLDFHSKDLNMKVCLRGLVEVCLPFLHSMKIAWRPWRYRWRGTGANDEYTGVILWLIFRTLVDRWSIATGTRIWVGRSWAPVGHVSIDSISCARVHALLVSTDTNDWRGRTNCPIYKLTEEPISRGISHQQEFINVRVDRFWPKCSH